AAIRLPMALRELYWWNGHCAEPPVQPSAYLPDGGVARLSAMTPSGAPLVLIVKAGHNAENHNHNDVGSFILHAAGETLLCDPGPPDYTREYFGSARYDNVYANSRGHSVPVIGGRLQSPGPEYRGEFVETDLEASRLVIEFARAYDAPELKSLRRSWELRQSGQRVNALTITDLFDLAEPAHIEEPLVSRLPMHCQGNELIIEGERTRVVATCGSSPDAVWEIEPLEESPLRTGQERMLHRARLAFSPPAGRTVVEILLQLSPA
ncbi:unnamed protein product, partial [marine sediment metagenome]